MGLKTFVESQVLKLEEVLNDIYVTKSPLQLPPWFKEIIVRLLPLLTIILIPLLVFAIYISCFSTCDKNNNFGLSFIAWWFQFFSIWGLFRRKKSGWNLLFYASIFNVIGSAITLSIIGLVFSAIIGWYILFQVRSMYK